MYQGLGFRASLGFLGLRASGLGHRSFGLPLGFLNVFDSKAKPKP